MPDYQNKLSIPCDWIEEDITILQLRQPDLLPSALHDLVYFNLYVPDCSKPEKTE